MTWNDLSKELKACPHEWLDKEVTVLTHSKDKDDKMITHQIIIERLNLNFETDGLYLE